MKNKVIMMRAGEEKAVSLPSHSANDVGHYTFVVTGLDMNQHTQWSVVGARKSELAKTDPNKVGCDRLIVYVLEDQELLKGGRKVNVSVIGTDNSTKKQVETKGTLTINIAPVTHHEDFTMKVSHPDHATIQFVSGENPLVLVPAKIEVEVELSEGDSEMVELHVVCDVDVAGYPAKSFDVIDASPDDDGHQGKSRKADITSEILKSFEDAKNQGMTEAFLTVRARKFFHEEWEGAYHHTYGGRIIIRKVD